MIYICKFKVQCIEWAYPSCPCSTQSTKCGSGYEYLMQALEDSASVYLTKLSKGELPGQLVETDIPVNPNTGYAMSGKVTNVYAHSSGGGKYMAVLQCKKTVHTDEGKQRQAALLAFSAFPELKHVILVDEDVDAEKWKDYF